MDSVLTSAPTDGSSMASARMRPAQNPSDPTHRAGRTSMRMASRYTVRCSFGTSSNMGWSRSIWRLFNEMARPNSGVITRGMR